MNRQIKFRVWDGDHMYYQDQMMVILGKDEHGKPGFWQTATYADISYFGPDSTEKESVLMQFTGLIDKNEVEIYEGDVISYDISEISHIKEPLIGEVIFNTDHTLSNLEWGLMTKNGYHPLGIGIYEVLGNRHQNPNLI